jgi:signal transduction histidine kinase
VRKIMKNVLEGGPLINVEYAALNKDGYEFPAEFSASAIKDHSGNPTGFVAIIKDITERKLMENDLRRYSERLEELVEERTMALKESQERLVKAERLAAIGQAATIVGHDLRNPLQAIENGIYYINTELSNRPNSQNIKETLQAIHGSVEYADNIVKELQSFASKREPLFRKIDINTLVKETFSHVKTPENVETIIELGELPKIEADKDMMKRIFVNLAVNGIQAMKEKRGILKVSTKETNGFIEIKFQDTGVGIKKENVSKIFTPFFTTKAQGMGVGLPISKRFVEIHNGNIKVESKEGEGSIFTVKLPIQRNGGVKLD